MLHNTILSLLSLCTKAVFLCVRLVVMEGKILPFSSTPSQNSTMLIFTSCTVLKHFAKQLFSTKTHLYFLKNFLSSGFDSLPACHPSVTFPQISVHLLSIYAFVFHSAWTIWTYCCLLYLKEMIRYRRPVEEAMVCQMEQMLNFSAQCHTYK